MDDDRTVPSAEWSFDILKVSVSSSGSFLVFRNRTKTFIKVLPQDPRMMALLEGRPHAYFEFHNDAKTMKLHVGPEVTGMHW